MTIRQMQIQTQGKKSKKAKAKHKNCKACGCQNLICEGPDQFCTKCDWHSCLEYVDKGYMNNLYFAYCEQFPKANKKLTIVDLPKGNAPIVPDTKPKSDADKKSA